MNDFMQNSHRARPDSHRLFNHAYRMIHSETEAMLGCNENPSSHGTASL